MQNNNDINFNNIKELVIVLVGYWNVRIFNPAWLQEYLLKGLEFNSPINFSLDLENMIISGYKFDGIELTITPNSIKILLSTNDSENVYKANKILLNILKLLPFTPIKGIGFNVKYIFSSTDKVNYIQEYQKVEGIVNNKFELSTYSKRVKEDDCLVNLSFNKIDNDYILNFNFHYEQNFDFKDDTFLNKISNTQKYLYE